MRLGIVIFVSTALLVAAQSAIAAPAASQAGSAAHASSIPPDSSAGEAGVLVSNTTADPQSTSGGGSLPFTGLDLRIVVVAGALLVVAGSMVRKRAARSRA